MEVSPGRALTNRERDVLAVLVEQSGDRAQALNAQLNDLKVSGVCCCGCPSIYFGHGEAGGGIEVVAGAHVQHTNDSVLLFVSSNGWLDSLEYVWVGESPPAEFPPPTDLASNRP